MGCKNCKQKNQNQSKPVTENVTRPKFISNVMSDDAFNGSFFLKVIIFLIIVLAIPFIIIALIFQVFITFFLPTSVDDINKGIKNFFKNLVGRYVSFIDERKTKRRERQFENNRGYEEDSELLDVEVYENFDDNKEVKVN